MEGGFVNVLMAANEGYLLSVQNTALPGVETFDTDAAISAEGATALAFQQLLLDTGIRADEIGSPELVISQFADETTRAPRLTWFVQASAWRAGNDLPPVSFYYNFDADSGELAGARDAVLHYDVSGKIESNVTTDTNALYQGSAVSNRAMSRIYIYDSSGNTILGTTAEDGTFTIPGTHPVTIKLVYEGEATPRIQNQTGSKHEESFVLQNATGNYVLMNSKPPLPTEEVTAQANAYYWITRMHDWILATNPLDGIWGAFGVNEPTLYVNDAGPGNACNATAYIYPPRGMEFGGSDTTSCASFCANVTCTNHASATIIAHETGHLLRELYNGFANSAFDEGLADVYALYLTDQVIDGEDICLGQPLCATRRGDNAVRVCPTGNCYGSVYVTGQALTGAFWKMRERLKQSQGALGGFVADVLHNAWMNAYNEFTITPTTRTHLLILDDVPTGQGLRDGTPHWADIDLGFADQGYPRHAIMRTGIAYSNIMDPGQTTNESGPYTISADIEAGFATPIQSASLHYRVDGGSFNPPIAMSQSGNTFTGTIPGPITAPAVVEYYLSATDSMLGSYQTGQTTEYPVSIKVAMDATQDQLEDDLDRRFDADDATPVYQRFFIGERETIFFEDFDDDPPPVWDHGGDEDDWQIADPTGKGSGSWADPDDASSPPNCAGNDLGIAEGQIDGEGDYEPEANNYLRTPVGSIDLSGVAPGGRVFLRFQRWLSVQNFYWDFGMDAGPRDYAELFVVFPAPGPDPEIVWKNHRAISHVDNASNSGAWVPFEIEITSAIGNADEVQIEWRLRSDDDNASNSLYGGWTIDDVEVFKLEPIQ